MNIIIDTHKNLIEKDFNYVILDPEQKHNIIKDITLTQKDIINYIIVNNLDSIKIEYKNRYIIQYVKIENDKIKINPLEPNSIHLLRLIGLKLVPKYSYEINIIIDKKYIQDFIIEIISLLDENNKINIMDLCTVCAKELNIKGLNKISCCNNNDCLIQSKHLVMDNRLTEMLKKDPYLFEILIDIMIEGINHPKEEMFKPIPKIKNVSNISDLKNIIEKEKNNININKISKSNNEIELYNDIGDVAYALISSAISDNYFSLSTINIFDILINNKKYLLKNSIFDSEDIKFIGFNYSYEIESKYPKRYFLFHGTSLHSWYPIIKNGLKVMSGTKYMANGAAYGNGIYLSDRFNMSLGYSNSGIIINTKESKKKTTYCRCI